MKLIDIYTNHGKIDRKGDPIEMFEKWLKTNFKNIDQTIRFQVHFPPRTIKGRPSQKKKITLEVSRYSGGVTAGPYFIRIPELFIKEKLSTFKIVIYAHEGLILNNIHSDPNLGLTGRHLLVLAENIARTIGFPTIRLEDASSVSCDGEKVYLAILRTFRDGRTWYESNGYVFEAEQHMNHATPAKYKKLISHVRSLKFSNVLSQLVNAKELLEDTFDDLDVLQNVKFMRLNDRQIFSFDPEETIKTLIEDHYEPIVQTLTLMRHLSVSRTVDAKKTFASQMANLEKKNCRAYATIQDKLFKPYFDYKDIMIPFLPNRQALYEIDIFNNMYHLGLLHGAGWFQKTLH